ncbi:protein of unknown function (DUF397) [Streptoalloteichus tenebrarius]|uniref:DUF397 domain-containing protein n=1 Tax=Streptoalloteichus tenebrarius (strain ATCC 17920 / DSM 40477 / JCM 4838 / CBS 697.72 / NBRC 16177 / NCIMB 11028 / NRRL B-12390 / A12253. 1 / ISP 5477) TaxID=1933 RepID=A0ABT1HPC7_STRSD|nr:DUF397 domain-containing protein [Streptoalloteichus tenebrarius]MCP2257374.1 protein of unknown function (DUF397) [Streptoalloteichus tenebrarius]BFF04289.1 hypothetical protein GCM10020241_59640 [Streptoalloteichus tenebrarius]
MTTGYKWRKSSRSSQSTACVEVAGDIPGGTAVRDSKDPNGPELVLTPAVFTAFVRAVKSGRLDLS